MTPARREPPRPTHTAITRGPQALSRTELLSLFLNGTQRGKRRTPVDIARTLLAEHGSLYEISRCLPAQYMHVPGIGAASAARLSAAFELHRRALHEAALADHQTVRAPADIARIFAPLMRELDHEIVRVIHLNTANRVTAHYVVSKGGIASAVLDPRMIFRRAIVENAASVIAVHCHPSGNPEPSREDIRITRQLDDAGRVIGIPLLDHIIIAGSTFTSLAERGIIDGTSYDPDRSQRPR